MMMILAMVMAAATPVMTDLVPGEGEQHCLPDKSLCLTLPKNEGSSDAEGTLTATTPGNGNPAPLVLPYGFGDGQSLQLWPHLIAVPQSDEGSEAREYLAGVIVDQSTMYSGGGGSGGRLHLFRLDESSGNVSLRDEVLDVVWDSSLMIRACFSEQDMKDRREACHDEYSFTGKLTPAENDSSELPALTYRSVATAYPQSARRSEDNSGLRLKASDLTRWTDPECSYTRILRYNPATSRYEMDRPAPDCSAYTTP